MFVSSTYYDLKYVRERLERFLYTYNMEPILFERDDVYFNPVETIDISCYNEVHNCQMMILIIGGRYGSLASTKEDYEKKYVSVTQKEYNTAISKGIPVMIFVDSNVYTEYRTYQKNKHSLPDNFKFAYVDDLQVFEFIASVEQQAIKTFSRIEDIEQVCSEIDGVVVPVNYNSPGQVVISGDINAVKEACRKLKEAGAKRALPLPVGGAYHSPLMEPARVELASAIEKAEFHTPRCPIYQNVDAKPYTDPALIKANLLEQLTSAVRWTQTVLNMKADGMEEFVECGPGQVLTGLMGRILK